MSDAQETVARIRDILAASDQSTTEEALATAVTYRQLCRDTNVRLRQCLQLLRQGLQAEAIHQAEAAPVLLDQVALLDFPERADWAQWCLHANIPEPPAIDRDAATALNDAYTNIEPLEKLLVRHRLLALTLAPLPARIAVMRRLAEIDSASSFWSDDIKAFETARLEDIRRRMDVPPPPAYEEVETWRGELTAGHWRAKPPDSLRQDVEKLYSRHRADRAAKTLAELLPALDTAYHNLDEGQCRTLLGQYDQNVADAPQAASKRGEVLAEDARQWLAKCEAARRQQESFDAACVLLEQAMDQDQKTLPIQNAYRAATTLGLPLPGTLEARYNRLMHQRDAAAARTRRLTYTSIIAGTVAILAVTGVLLFLHLRHRQIATWDNVLDRARHNLLKTGSEGRAEQVLTLLRQEPSSVTNDPGVASRAEALAGAVAADKKRAAAFKGYLAQAESLGLNNSDDAALKNAQSLARTKAELAAVNGFAHELAMHRAAVQSKVDAQFAKRAGALEQRILTTVSTQAILQNPADAGKQLARLITQIEKLGRVHGVSSGVHDSEMASLAAMVKDRSQKIATLGGDVLAYDNILTPPASVAQYVASIAEYLKNEPKGRFVLNVQKLQVAVPALRAVRRWADLTVNWPGPEGADGTTAMLAAIDKYLKSNPLSPLKSQVLYLKSDLTAQASAAAPDGPWKKTLSHVLNNPLLHDLRVLKNSGKVYYIPPGAKINESSLNDSVTYGVQYLKSADITDTGLRSFTLPQGGRAELAPSNEAVYSHWALQKIAAATDADSRTLGLRLLEKLCTSPMNAVVKGILATDLIILSDRTLPQRFQPKLATALSQLQALNLDSINWLSPNRSLGADVTSGVTKALATLPHIKRLISKVEGAQQAHAAAAAFAIRSLGIYEKQDESQQIASNSPPSNGDIAYMVEMAAGDSGAKLVHIATFVHGQWKFRSTNELVDTPNGTLIFVSAWRASPGTTANN